MLVKDYRIHGKGLVKQELLYHTIPCIMVHFAYLLESPLNKGKPNKKGTPERCPLWLAWEMNHLR